MRSITTKTDFETALQILVDAFQDIPGTTWMLKKNRRRFRLKELCLFCLRESIDMNGAYISDNGKGVALVFKNGINPYPFKRFFRQVRLVHRAFGWANLFNVVRHQTHLNQFRPKDGLYFWMLAANNQDTDLSPVVDLKNAIFNMADHHGQHIYLETTIYKNMLVYRRYGFEIYHEEDHPTEGFHTWFMVKKPHEVRVAASVA